MQISKQSRMRRSHNQRNTQLRSKRLDDSFRRNAVVVSKSQRTIKERQQSVTQRQFDQQKKQRRHLRRVRLVAVAITLIFVVLVLQLRVQKLELVENKRFKLAAEDKALYQMAVEKSVQATTFMSQSWLLDQAQISAAVSSQYPEVEALYIAPKSLVNSAAKLEIIFRTPLFVWKDADSKDHYVDKNGVLFSKNRNSAVHVERLVHIEDQSGVVLKEGSSVLTQSLIQFVGQLPAQAAAVYGPNVAIKQVMIPQSIREVRFKVKGIPYSIKLSSSRGLGEQMADLKLVVKHLRQRGRTPSSYIDVRIAGKAFYK